MSHATRPIQVTSDGAGHVTVTVPAELRPLGDFLAAEIGDDSDTLSLVAEQAGDPSVRSWGFGGDACHLALEGDSVTVSNDYTELTVTLSRTEFLEIVRRYRDAVLG